MGESLQDCLMDLLIRRDSEELQHLLERKNKDGIPLVDVNYVYGDPHYMTCLGKAACAKEDLEKSAEIIRILLKNGADPNLRFETHSNRAAIHFAVERNNLPALQALLENENLNPNIRNKMNQTPVYLAALSLPNSIDCFKCLVFHPKVNVKMDTTKLTAIGKAADKNCDKELLLKIIKHVNYLRKDDKKKILEKYPGINIDIDLAVIPDEEDDGITTSTLYRYLELGKLKEFKHEMQLFMKSIEDPDDSIKKAVDLISADDTLKMTFLQLASWNGFVDIVEFLVNLGVDINASTNDEKRPPIHLTSYKGNYDILSLLVSKGANFYALDGKTVLHSIFTGLGTTRADHKKCFDCLLKKNSSSEFLNRKDNYGHTALHYAVLEKDDYYAKELMKHGAYIGVKNNFGISPLDHIEADVLESALNNCIQHVGKDEPQQYTLKINFKMLKPQNDSEPAENQNSDVDEAEHSPFKPRDAESGKKYLQEFPEMYPLLYISQSKKMDHLLKHPVLIIFLHLKWKRIMPIFLLNIIFYLLFVICLTINVFYLPLGLQSNCMPKSTGIIFHLFLCLLFIILVIREGFQIIILDEKLDYFRSLENWLEVGIVVTFLIRIGICSDVFSALILILAWTALILQCGCFMKLAVYNELLKRVIWNYLKFFVWYFPLLMAFTLSFYKLYHVEEGAEKENEKHEPRNKSLSVSNSEDGNTGFYGDLSLSFIKTVVMMIGEFDASDMKDKFTHGGKVVFLIFVFMITIVLSNLLNGLAVSDTQAIRDEAEIVILRYRVKLIFLSESVLLRYNREGLAAYLPWKKYLINLITFFSEASRTDCLLRVLSENKPNGRFLVYKMWNGKDSNHRPDECFTLGKYKFGYYLDPEVFDNAKDIVGRRNVEDVTTQLQQLKQDVKEIKKNLANFSTKNVSSDKK